MDLRKIGIFAAEVYQVSVVTEAGLLGRGAQLGRQVQCPPR